MFRHNDKPICIRIVSKMPKKNKSTDPRTVFKGLKKVPKIKMRKQKVSVEHLVGRLK